MKRPHILLLRSSSVQLNTITSFVTSQKKHPIVCNPPGTFLKVVTLNPPLQLLYVIDERQSLYITLHTSFESCLVSQLWHNTVGPYLLRQALSCINGVILNSFTLNTRLFRMKKSKEMQQYADIYLLLNYSTCFGRPSRPSPGVRKTVVSASGTGHIIWGASFFKRDQVLIWSRLNKLASQII